MDTPQKKTWNSSGSFDAEAAKWDENPRRIDLAHQILSSLDRMLPFRKEWKAMEAGCGTGMLSLPVSERVSSLTAIDASEGMLGVLDRKAREERIENITTIHSDIAASGPDGTIDGPFDLVYSSMTFHHIENTRALVRTLTESLLPGGWLAVADLDEEDGFFHDRENENVHHGFNRESFETMLREEGFDHVSFTTAASMNKVNRAGRDATYTVFLAVARKGGWQ